MPEPGRPSAIELSAEYLQEAVDDIVDASFALLGIPLRHPVDGPEQGEGEQAGIGDRLEELANQLPDRVAAVSQAAKALQNARAAAAEARKACQQVAEGLGDGGLSCPHCGAEVAIRRRDGFTVLVPWNGKADKEAATAARAKAEAAQGEAEKRHEEMVRAEVALKQAEAAHKEAEAAFYELAKPASDAAGADVDGAREATQQARRDREMWRAWRGATQAAARVGVYTALAAQLGPDGIRAEVMRRKLNELNGELREICTAAGWQIAEVGDTFGIYYAGRPLAMCSESEQWRAAAALQVAIARREKSAAVILDRADVLDGGGRSGLLKMLLKLRMPALVAMTANAPDKVPDLAAKGAGCTYWVEAGSVAPVGNKAAAA